MYGAVDARGTGGASAGPFASRTYLLPVTTAGASEGSPGRVPQPGGRFPVESGHGRQEARLASFSSHLPPPSATAAAAARAPAPAPAAPRGGDTDLRPVAQGVALGHAAPERFLA